ncbi:amino acid transporter, putative [Entamoeba histolytica HM-1:IMSS-B]|uniref:Amino acid transporter, putative n=6 Tax=Entamoeba histolytica TaxID=5759 RepID=C4M8E3_ENTH1|nr:amino acid transporter, putative [Entamoeba histolytica HM-1:IMSS]EMD47182.1 amino acid transporter, putative [Entamoeba histolytica KU27]EMH72138.1 amino acid transporter, putative [Entamoeba histolytica HM-1:IMSS-B]EMS10912.1 amino acid transporter, putative [Entamoeba histolytica HM-3:IMSS]ENY65433.1 amino acid transporter, putative [Entamoeba histolytica HM-1:IMSS-A]GAT97866.1 amino acid transporter putative [Entamoeba histolytica]|eukprot:XP_649987.1 amino acid transporter, putative [Entamoeba histolytica HM-1:IMSS]
MTEETTLSSNLLSNEKEVVDEEGNGQTEPIGTAGIPGTIFNLANTVIGSGTLAIPLAFQYSGYTGGITLLLIAWILSAFAMYLLTYVSAKTKLWTYKDISLKVGGKIISYIVQISIFCYTTGTCIAYPIFLGGFMPHVFSTFAGSTILVDRHFDIMIVCFCIIIPISLFKNLSALKYSSLISLACIIYTTLTSCIEFFTTYHDNIDSHPPQVFNLSVEFLRGFPYMTCAFTAHYNVLRFYSELKNRSITKMNVIVVSSTLCSFVVYLLIGLFGYFSLTPNITGNILVDYPTSDIPMFVACCSFCIVMTTSFPLVHHAQRDLFDKLVFSGWQESNIRRITLSLVLISLCMFLATGIEQISTVLAYNGSIFGALVVYVFPAFFAFRVATGLLKWVSLGVMIIGFILGGIGLTITILTQFGVFD